MSDHSESSHESSSVFDKLRQEGDFCDAVIKVKDAEFQVHKVVLCNCSPYFLALFRRWATPDQKVFDISGVSPDMMQLVIEFAYTGSVSVMEDNVQELMLAADQLNIMAVVQTCCDFLGERLCTQNCIGIFQFTFICFHPRLRAKAYHFIIDHFEEVVFTQEFLQLSVQELTDLLERQDINVRKESTVFEAVLRWIAHMPEERNSHIAVLLSKVRLALLSLDYLQLNVMANELVTNNAMCQSMVREAHDIVDHFGGNRAILFHLCNPLVRPRLPKAILLAIGGWSGSNPTNAIEAYDIRTDNWINVTNYDERSRAYHGTVFLNGDVYCVGGFDRAEHFNSVRRFSLSSRTWHEVAPMYYRRCYVSVTVLNGCIYAMGGYDGYTRQSTAERYTPETNQWSLIASMHESRSDASCTTLHNKIYICGGFNGHDCLQTAECYHPETNQWTMIGLMTSQRSGVGVTAYADHVFAVGGFDGSARLRSAEAYNPRTNTWHEVSVMVTPRSNFGIAVLEDLLFVVGGFNGHSTTYNVEYYDATTNDWHVACDMDINRSAVSCCVVSELDNIVAYVSPRDALPFVDSEDECAEFESGDSD
uniref:kelch-like protein 10 n=1 Tax=Epinephelus lanceolatus TaxID=310571 RepID=UPI0014481082|nr:kelch-like protein 10 [Epinephelus lanceolatus]